MNEDGGRRGRHRGDGGNQEEAEPSEREPDRYEARYLQRRAKRIAASRADTAKATPAALFEWPQREPDERERQIQRLIDGITGRPLNDVQDAAARGTSGATGPLPHLEQIQRSFGHHDVSHVQAHTDAAAAEGAEAMGAHAFAAGDHVAFNGAPDLHTAAHEAAHVVQQRGGVQLKGGVGESGDTYERHADAVADRVVAGQSAEVLLDQHAGEGGHSATVQRSSKDAAPHDSTEARCEPLDAGVTLSPEQKAELLHLEQAKAAEHARRAQLVDQLAQLYAREHPQSPPPSGFWAKVKAFLVEKWDHGNIHLIRDLKAALLANARKSAALQHELAEHGTPLGMTFAPLAVGIVDTVEDMSAEMRQAIDAIERSIHAETTTDKAIAALNAGLHFGKAGLDAYALADPLAAVSDGGGSAGGVLSVDVEAHGGAAAAAAEGAVTTTSGADVLGTSLGSSHSDDGRSYSEGQSRGPEDKAAKPFLNKQGQLTNGVFTIDAPGMAPHKTGSLVSGKSQWLSSVDAESAVLDAAARADAEGLWVGAKAKIMADKDVGVLAGTGELTRWINVYKTKTGFVHGCPGTPR